MAWSSRTDPRLLIELQRLLHQHIISSVIPAVLLALLVVWTLASAQDAWPLRLWGAAVIGWKLLSAWVGHQQLRHGIPLDKARRNVLWLIALNAIDGAIWGALAWVALGSTTLAGSILVVAVIGGIAGSSMSSLSPVFPAFVAFVVCLLSGLASRLWTLGDPAYDALGVAGVLYTASLLGQSRNSGQAARQAITLRFENIELIERLRQEMAYAQAQRQAAEQANVAKSRFLAAASHDLRQPIHAQGLFLEVLGNAALKGPQVEALDNARATWRASAEMLDTLLDFSRIEAGVIEPQRRLFALQPMLHRLETELAPQADAKGLVYRSRETPAVVFSDPAQVALILRNLVSNAVRYTEHGGVLLGCRRRGRHWLVEVWDTGIGIPASQHQAIFQEFHQLGNAERDRRKGLGLGLAIAQGLSRTLGHALSLASHPGRGSVFRLALPCGDDADAAVPLWDDELAPPATSHDTVLACTRVLVIDDDETVRDGMRQTLAGWGCVCDAAESIEDALAMARAQAPDLVISDYRLRDQRTGAEAIALLRAAIGPKLPALLVTGDTAPERLREAIDTGVALLHKPVAPAMLHRRMAEVLRARHTGPMP